MVQQCKPEPEIYLTAAKELGINIEECIIFEDARAGFEAAKRAGAGLVIGIATTLTKAQIEAENLADIVIEDFTELSSLEQFRK